MSNRYIYTFGLIMTVVVAGVLAGLKMLTKPLADKNEEVFNKRALLEAVAEPIKAATDQSVADLTDAEVLEIFNTQIKQYVVDAQGSPVEGLKAIEVKMDQEKKKAAGDRVYPIYEFDLEGKKFYIFSVIGNGLWDIIWGNIALESDFSTIAGVSFDHAGETPGLGAEIKDNNDWKSQFLNKQLFEDGKLVGVNVKKGGATPGSDYEVDGLSGATITADGVTDMIYNGFQPYENYIKEQTKNGGTVGMLIQ